MDAAGSSPHGNVASARGPIPPCRACIPIRNSRTARPAKPSVCAAGSGSTRAMTSPLNSGGSNAQWPHRDGGANEPRFLFSPLLMHVLLSDPDAEAFLIEELQRSFPAGRHRIV